jgi:leucyl aminopeptidase
MEVIITAEAREVHGWIFLPVKTPKGVLIPKGTVLKNFSATNDEWAALNEGAWQEKAGAVFKAAPVEAGERALSSFRDALGKGLKFMAARKVKNVAVFLPDLPDHESIWTALLEVPFLLTYDALRFKSKPDPEKKFLLERICFIPPSAKGEKRLKAGLARTQVVMQGVNWARRLTDDPGNLLGPQELVKEAETLRADGIAVRTLDRRTLGRMGGLLAVGAGSRHEPQVLFLELNPGKTKPIALVGKGVTFDSGGLSLKPADSMPEMKTDMAGAAAVLGTMKVLATLKCRRHVVGVIPLVENMPDGKAFRPGDIITMFDGQTVEILNTDAEGRLILADALAYVSRFSPECTIDIATLTGAVIVALGHQYTGLFGNDEALKNRILAAAGATGELMWSMPIHWAFQEEMKSPLADWKNSGGRKAGAGLAAAFLRNFVSGPWAHLDIAGSSLLEKDSSFFPKGGTGVGVRLLTDLILER